MRKIPVSLLGVMLGLLVWCPAVRAQRQSLPQPLPAEASGAPSLTELRLYFLHLANVDAAADKADAEGTPGDTAAWRRFEQEKAGLTETEAALLKDVAFRCNRTLAEDLEGQEPMEIVRQTVDELRTVLGPSAFEAVSQRIRTFLRPAITSVPAAVAEGAGTADEEEVPVEVEAVTGPSVSVYSLLFKLQDGNYMAQCGTAPNDGETLNRYAGGVTMVCEVFGGDLPAPIQVPCGSSPSSTSCSGTYPPVPNRTRVLSATHGLRMKLLSSGCQVPDPIYDDPLAFCRTGRSAPNFIEDGDVTPLVNGVPTCWDPAAVPNVCKIATSSTPQISFIELSPSESTAYPGGTVRFSSAGLQAIWTVEGPGTIDSTGLYTAPFSILSEQTVTVKGCDAYAPGDCDTATVTLKPLQVQVAPSPVEVLPERETTLTATLIPAVSGQLVEWSMTPNVGTLTPSGNTVTYKAPPYEQLAGNTEITVTACLRPATGVCSTATVIVPKLLFTITAPKTKLELNESVQLTASLHGSNVQRSIFWVTPSAGTLSEISPADPFIRLYKAPGAPPFADVVIKACLVADPGFCAELPLDLPKPLWVTSFESDTGRWQAGTLTDFTITGEGFRPELQIGMGDLPVTVTSMTETLIKGKVRILVPATGVPLTLFITYPDGTTSATTRSPKEVEPATVAVSPATATVQGGGSKVFGSVCLTSTALPCTSQEIPSWTASQGAITPAGLNATYTAPASVTSQGAATVTACWYHGGQSKCGFAAVTLLPNGPIVSVTPKTDSLEPGQTRQFTAQVTNDPNTAVTWSATAGTISSSGLYTAPSPFAGPATVTVTATSVADSSRKDTATVTLVPVPLTVTSTASKAAVYYGNPLTWTATASGGVPGTYQYALFRRKSGTTTWIPALESPVWQAGNLLGWTPSSSDVGTWDIRVGARDSYTSSPVLHDPGAVQVVPPLTITCPTIPPYVYPGTAVTFTITVSGGTGVGRQYAVFRRRAGTVPWAPDVTSPPWQSSNVYTWTPGAGDVGTWELYIWAKDSATPPNQNTYGYAVGCSPGTVQVLPLISLVTTPSPAASYYGQTINWTATATGNVPASTQYALFRRKVGTSTWIPAQTAPAWQTGNALSWTPAATDAGNWEISVWVRDGSTPPMLNTYGYAASYNPGQVNVVPPMTLTGTTSPASANTGTTLTWTATASGGTGAGRQYAFFRRRAGTTPWTPDVTQPAWQTSNVLSWTPGAADVGTWETYIWTRDSATPPTMNTYGHAAWYNSGNVQVVAPLTVTSTPSPAAAYHGRAIAWNATATGGVPATTQFALVRRRTGTTAWTPATWQASGSLSWTPSSTDVGVWDIAVWVRDGNTAPTMNGSGYAASYDPGQVNVVPPMSLTGTVSPAGSYTGQTLTWTATASGGTGVGRRYALFRRRAGTTPWTPNVTQPAWQTSNVLSWTPGAADVGTWETCIWVKDSATPPDMNTYGHAAWYNSGTVQLVPPLGVTSNASPSLVTHGSTIITWTANATGGVPATTQYALRRRVSGTSAWLPASPAWQTSNLLSWTPGPSDIATWEIAIWVRDGYTPPNMNGSGYAAGTNPGQVRVVAPLTVTGSGSPAAAYHGNPLTWTANGSGGTGVGRQYAFFRRKAGTSSWTPDVTAPAWQTSNVMSWTPSSSDVATWEIIIWFKDANTAPNANTYGFDAYYNAGPVQVYAHPTVSGTGSPASSPYGTTLTWTATASGGTGSARQYALFRRRAGTTTWIPALTSPAWQSSNTMSWTPSSADVGTWEIFVWLKDANTPPTMNTYGFAAYYNAGPVQVAVP